MVSYFNKGVVFEEVRRSLSLDLLDLEAGRQGLLQLLGLLLVLDHQIPKTDDRGIRGDDLLDDFLRIVRMVLQIDLLGSLQCLHRSMCYAIIRRPHFLII